MSMFSTSFGFRQPYQVLGAYEPAYTQVLFTHSLTRSNSRLYDVRNGRVIKNGLCCTNGVCTRWNREAE